MAEICRDATTTSYAKRTARTASAQGRNRPSKGVGGSGATVVVDTSILDGLQTKTQGMLRDTEVQEAAFAAALGGVSAEDYAAWAATLPEDRGWHPGIFPVARLKVSMAVSV